MRKGRSQRRTRKSVPSKPAGSGTQLFVGVSSAPPPPSASSLDPMDALEKLEVVETKAAIERVEPAPATDSEPPAAIEAKHVGTTVTRVELEPTHVGTTVTRMAIEVTPEARADSVPQDSLAPVVVAEPSAAPSEPPPADAEAKHEEPTPYVPEVAEKLAEAEASPSEEKDAEPEASKAEAAPEATTQKSAAIDRYEEEEEEDDRTPPAVEFGAAEEFFEAGRRASLAPETTETFEDLEKVKQKHLPHVVARRAKFARYVGWAVGIAGVVCLAAVARTAFSPSAAVASASTKNAVVAQPVAAAEPPKAEEAKPEPAKAAEAPKAEEPKAEEPKPEEAKAEAPKTDEAKPEPPKAEEPKAAAGGPEPVAPSPTVTAATTGNKTAREEKRASQQALERGKAGESIAAGERSVALDPGDAEAWLILGAAYQQKGDLANMRRAFKSCLEQATRGPKGECAQFAH